MISGRRSISDGRQRKRITRSSVKTKPTSKTGISITSPIARAIVGKSVGDVVDVVAPGGKHSYEVMVVRYV